MIRTARQTSILAERDRLLQIQADYRAEVKYYREHTKYRVPACIHGTSNWTDYDNICGGCEDGTFTEYTDGVDLLILARDAVDADERARAAWIKRRATEARRYFDLCWEYRHTIPQPMATAFQMAQA